MVGSLVLYETGVKSNKSTAAALVTTLILGCMPGVTFARPDSTSLYNPKDSTMKTVVVILYNGVELMDFAGPAEVFITTNEQKSFKVVTVADSLSPVITMGGVSVNPDYTYGSVPKADIIVVPGGNMQEFGEVGRQWLKTASTDAYYVLSVCFGAFILADVGLLDGIEATTHHWGLKGLTKAAPKCKVMGCERYIASGKIVSTAGVTAGIDGALHIVEKLLGKEAANWTAGEWMEYQRITNDK